MHHYPSGCVGTTASIWLNFFYFCILNCIRLKTHALPLPSGHHMVVSTEVWTVDQIFLTSLAFFIDALCIKKVPIEKKKSSNQAELILIFLPDMHHFARKYLILNIFQVLFKCQCFIFSIE